MHRVEIKNTPSSSIYLTFLSMCYICLLFCSAMISSKIIATPLGGISAGSITGPFWFILSDIITEVYGYKITKNIFIAAMLCEFIFMVISILLLMLPSPSNWPGAFAYEFVTGHFMLIYFSQLFAIIIAWNINTRLLLRWKALLRGRYFWLRSIGSSGIAEILFSILAVSINMLGRANTLGINLEGIIHIVSWSITLKIVFSIIFAYPATIVIRLLYHFEKIDYSTQRYLFDNPFK